MKVELLEIELQNFWSFGNAPTTVNLNTDLVTLIIGNNRDSNDEGHAKNGVGKTAIYQAIFWCLFGEGITNVKADDFVNLFNGKRMYVALKFRIGDATYELTRGRKPNKIELTKDRQPYTRHNTGSVEDDIRDLIGLNASMFKNTVLLTTNTDSFMALKPAQQRDFMEDLLNLHMLSYRAKGVKVLRDDNSTELRLEEQSIRQKQEQNAKTERSIEQLESKKQSWDQEVTEGLKNYQEELKDLEQVDTDKELQKIQRLNEIKDKMKDVSVDLDKLERDTNQRTKDIEKCEHELKSLEAGECPYCQQKYDNEIKIDEVRTKVSEYNKALDELEQEMVPLLDREDKLKEELDGLMADEELMSEKEVNRIVNEIKRLNDKINDLKDQTVNPYADQIEVLKEQLEEVSDERMYELKRLDEHYKIMVKLLTDSKSFIRKNVIDRYIPYINKQLNGYLDFLDSPHGVLINNDLTLDIEYMGASISYGNLSNGEKLRLNLASNLAFRDMIEMTGRSMNIILIDEFLDNGGDQSFFRKAFNLFKSREQSVFIISHREDLQSEVDQTMTVAKQGGFSEIEMST